MKGGWCVKGGKESLPFKTAVDGDLGREVPDENRGVRLGAEDIRIAMVVVLRPPSPSQSNADTGICTQASK